MSRTLHVIDQPGPVAEAAVLRLSVDCAKHEPHHQSDQHAWLLFGGEATRDAARAIGLRDEQFRLMPEPVGLHRLMPGALARPRRLMNRAHRVVCWTEGATQIASLVGCAHVVRRVDHARLCPVAQRIIEQAHQAAADECLPDREDLRKRWGVDPGTCVIALIADRFTGIDASAAMLAVALTHEALHAIDPAADVRLLCHPLAKGRGEASQLAGLLKLDELLIQDANISMPWSVLPGCDAALAINLCQAGLSILWSQVLGVPIFTPRDEHRTMPQTLSEARPIRGTRPREVADALPNHISSHSTRHAHG